MNFFKYNTSSVNKSISEMMHIYEVVQNLSNYAKKIYKGRWEDALDVAYFHIIQNYDPSKGELENYATKVVGGVCLSQFRKEYPYEFISDLEDEKGSSSIGAVILDSKDERNQRVDINDCIDYLIPFFIRDFKFFKSMDSAHRKENYSELFKRFSASMISESITIIKERYLEDVERFYTTKKTCGGKRFAEDKLNKKRDNCAKYLGELNDTIIYKRTSAVASERFFYKLDIPKVISKFLDKFYCDGGSACVKIRDTIAYCTIRGEIVFSLSDLAEALERDITGIVLSRLNVRVLHYSKGERVILVSTNTIEYELSIPLFNDEVCVGFELMTSKEMGKAGK